jgi:hypothetical protein
MDAYDLLTEYVPDEEQPLDALGKFMGRGLLIDIMCKCIKFGGQSDVRDFEGFLKNNFGGA